MIWLIGLIAILQASFNWLLKPLIVLSTPLFEIEPLFILFVAVGVWLFTGRGKIY